MKTFFISWYDGICRHAHAKGLKSAKQELVECAAARNGGGSLLDINLRVVCHTEYRDGQFVLINTGGVR
jgi:hypothetical protein